MSLLSDAQIAVEISAGKGRHRGSELRGCWGSDRGTRVEENASISVLAVFGIPN
jgi:hypothetical protein